jgi:hypothetical protein
LSELERQLTALGGALDWPGEPDLRARVRARVEEPLRPLLPWRRTLVIAFALLVVGVGVAFAVPPARSAILRWFGLEHVKVFRVDELPPTRRLQASDLGDRTTFAAAQRRAGFKLRRLPGRAPDAVYATPAPARGVRVTLVYGSVAKPRLLLSEFRGVGTAKFVTKYASGGTKIELVQIEGNPGLWFSGAPHAVLYFDPEYPRLVYTDVALLAGNTLVWEQDAVTFRIEGNLDKSEALSLAKSLR